MCLVDSLGKTLLTPLQWSYSGSNPSWNEQVRNIQDGIDGVLTEEAFMMAAGGYRGLSRLQFTFDDLKQITRVNILVPKDTNSG